MYTVQVGHYLYAFKHNCIPAQWVAYWNLEERDVESCIKQNPPNPRTAPSLANFNDSFILAIGGVSPGCDESLSSVDIYSVELNTWQ